MLTLTLPKQTVEKFSVRVKDEVQFVHLFKSSANCTTYVKYCSGIWQTWFNKKVRAIHISDAAICDHLKKFKEYIDGNSYKHPLLPQLYEEIDDESDGVWDEESAAFHISDETDHDIEIPDRESMQVRAVCVCCVIYKCFATSIYYYYY